MPRSDLTHLSLPLVALLAGDDLLPHLAALARIKRECDTEQALTVKRLRSIGVSWESIAVSLGVTRQSAWERFGRLCDEVYDAQATAERTSRVLRRSGGTH
jgi:DNA invertase Pin-like site-specific DNA recombinase